MNEAIKQYMREIGRKGGQSKSQAKREAAKRNGFKANTKPLGAAINPSVVNYGDRDFSAAYR